MTPISIQLTPEEEKVLRLVAQTERRSLRLQAAVLIRQGLERRGLLKPIEQEISNEQSNSAQ